jgi:hypothetical protein
MVHKVCTVPGIDVYTYIILVYMYVCMSCTYMYSSAPYNVQYI